MVLKSYLTNGNFLVKYDEEQSGPNFVWETVIDRLWSLDS